LTIVVMATQRRLDGSVQPKFAFRLSIAHSAAQKLRWAIIKSDGRVGLLVLLKQIQDYGSNGSPRYTKSSL
jgi:hypothetical protein